jgi:hypothetical protein
MMDFSQVKRNFNRYQEQIKEAAYFAMLLTGEELTTQMKAEAPWTDRTGDARRLIHSEPSKETLMVKTSIGIGTDYGKYLEVCHEERFAVVWPVFMADRVLILESLAKNLNLKTI